MLTKADLIERKEYIYRDFQEYCSGCGGLLKIQAYLTGKYNGSDGSEYWKVVAICPNKRKIFDKHTKISLDESAWVPAWWG